MKESFVLMFRQGRRPLTEKEQTRRTEEVRQWAIRHINDSHGLDPRVLDDESRRFGDEAPPGAYDDRQVIALNFIDATDFDAAARIANTHPGLRYGVGIEVGRWRDPRAQSAAAREERS